MQRRHVVLMDANRIQRSIQRMAFSLAEEFHENRVVLLGINDRGFAVASRMCHVLTSILPNSCELARIVLDKGAPTIDDPDVDFNNKTVIIVDDVIFSGRTMQQAVTFVMQASSPDIIRCVALVDRGHRKFPVEPQFWGLECPTKLMEHVHVDLIPDAKLDQVILFQDTEHYLPQ